MLAVCVCSNRLIYFRPRTHNGHLIPNYRLCRAGSRCSRAPAVPSVKECVEVVGGSGRSCYAVPFELCTFFKMNVLGL